MSSIDALEEVFTTHLGLTTSREEHDGREWLGFGAPGSRIMWAAEHEGRLELSLDVEVESEDGIDDVAQEINRRAYSLKAVVIRGQRTISLRSRTGSRPLTADELDLEAAGLATQAFVDEVTAFGALLGQLKPVDGGIPVARPRVAVTLPGWSLDYMAEFLEPLCGKADVHGSSLVFHEQKIISQFIAVKSHEGQVENLVLVVARPMAMARWTLDDTQRLNALNLRHPSVTSFISSDLSRFGNRIHVPRGVRDDYAAVEAAVSQLADYVADPVVLEAFDAFSLAPPTPIVPR